jgi:ankyrin repeat protein
MTVSVFETRACTPKCKSANHAYELVGLLTKTDDPHVLLSGLQQCWNCHKVSDHLGRFLLHAAASCGRLEAVEWLVKYKKADLNVKTAENGWTPLHCAAFYGQIDVFIMLVRMGANLNVYDNDRLTPIEILADNKYKAFKYEPSLDGLFSFSVIRQSDIFF